MVWDFGGSKKWHVIFVISILGWVAEVYIFSNFLGFQISFILSCQLKITPINSCIIKKKIVIYSNSMLDIFPIFALPPKPILSQSWLLWNTIFKGIFFLIWSTYSPHLSHIQFNAPSNCVTRSCRPCDGQDTIKSETYHCFRVTEPAPL